MSRQIVNTSGQGLASSDGVKMAFASLIVGIVVLLIFFGLNKAGVGDRAVVTHSGSAMGAPNPEAT